MPKFNNSVTAALNMSLGTFAVHLSVTSVVKVLSFLLFWAVTLSEEEAALRFKLLIHSCLSSSPLKVLITLCSLNERESALTLVVSFKVILIKCYTLGSFWSVTKVKT